MGNCIKSAKEAEQPAPSIQKKEYNEAQDDPMYYDRLNGLHAVVGKHCDPKVAEVFTTVEQIKFGKRPFDHPKKDQMFQTWIVDDNGNQFQGEVDINGLKDGIGILVFEGSGLWVAHFKANIRHGPFWSIKKNGKIY